MSNETSSPSISYFSKKKNIICPICGAEVSREELLTGNGRLLAGNLTKELHRLYEPSSKYGKVYPLIYSYTVCSSCFFTGLTADFTNLKSYTYEIDKIKVQLPVIRETVEALLGPLNFSVNRGLREGIASCLIVVQVYNMFPVELSPTLKMGIASLRSAWLCAHAEEDMPDENYEYLSRIMYRKSSFFYRKAIEQEDEGVEYFSKNYFHLGPDQDFNFGYDGVLYLAGYLEFKYGSLLKPDVRYNALSASQRVVSRLVGLGKASKVKTASIIEHARDLYMEIKAEFKKNYNETIE